MKGLLPQLRTKIAVPPFSTNIVERLHLNQALDAAVTHALTCVVTPPGYGKTILLGNWAANTEHPVAWLTLDGSETNASIFVSLVATSLMNADPDLDLVGQQSGAGPVEPAHFLIGGLWSPLFDEVAASDSHYILILDDYQMIGDEAVHLAVQFLIDHAPQNLHVCIASRETLPLSLTRHRIADNVTILDANALRFSREEAQELLTGILGLDLTEEETASINQRVDGWPAGLRLAGLSLENSANPHSALARFGGDDRNVLNYLGEEVFSRIPQDVQAFLVRTSILSRLHPDLCDALTGTGNARQILTDLERRNLFISLIDNRGEWYRYHNLMSEFLQHLLRTTDGGGLPALYATSAQWHRDHGLIDEAIGYARASGDENLLESLMAENCDDFLQRGYAPLVREWLDRAPKDFLVARPLLTARLSWSYASTGRPHEIEDKLALIDLGVEQASRQAIDESEHQQIAYLASGLRARAACMNGDVENAIETCTGFLDNHDTEPSRVRSSILWTMGEALISVGEVEKAMPFLDDGQEIARAVGYPPLSHVCASWGSQATRIQGRLTGALDRCREEIDWSEQHLVAKVPSLGFVLVEIAEILIERNQISNAADILTRNRELGHSGNTRRAALFGEILSARIEFMRRRYNKVRAHLNGVREMAPYTEPRAVATILSASCALYDVLVGDLSEADDWARSFARSSAETDLPGGSREEEYLVYARVRLAQNRFSEALEILERIDAASRNGGRLGNRLRGLAYMSMAYAKLDRRDRSVDALSRALEIAEPEGYVRTFIEEAELLSQPMVWLARAPADQVSLEVRDYALRLTRIMEQEATDVVSRAAKGSGNLFSDQEEAELFQAYLSDPLTPRETEILRLVSTGLSNQGIAEGLGITINTVKGHIKHIFSKLDARSRTQAVARSRRWRLIT